MITQGRAANPASPDQVVATTAAAADLGLHVGSHLLVGLGRDNVRNFGPYARRRLTVVGIGVLNIQIVHDDIDTHTTGFLIGTPALAREYGACCSATNFAGLQLAGGSRYDAAAEHEYDQLLDTSPLTRSTGGQLVLYDTADIEAQAQRAIRPEAIALGVFAVIAMLAALIIGAQSVSRQLRAGAPAVLLGAPAVVISHRQAPHRISARQAPERRSGIVAAALGTGMPAAAVAGLRFALEPGRGRTAVPVRAVIAGAVLAAAVGAATLTFGASLANLISRPALYGWNFSYALYAIDGYGPLPASWTAPLLGRDPQLAAATGVYFTTVQIDGQTVPAMAAPVRAAVAPRAP